MTIYTLPELPYAYDALDPYIDEQTMRLHHDKHHMGYVTGANTALAKLEKARETGDFAAAKAVSRDLAFHVAGHINHVIFWENMGPNGGGAPTGDLAQQINKDFGSFDKFKAHFTAASAQVEGSGWGILGWCPQAEQLLVFEAENHQNFSPRGVRPILMLDVWEHAYYLKYQNRRAEYVENWWNVVNWENVAQRLNDATTIKGFVTK